jgi:hypothetical protein
VWIIQVRVSRKASLTWGQEEAVGEEADGEEAGEEEEWRILCG